ncbi:hypothetical protein H696_01026 [Fonticula alba]|uniref:Translation initiation factor eIF2B subunit epsilon n=1 Tax=Fonticula alba TaxID=691883 RepID=A0A058ZCE9_FONAL|nr:hypothetical protein H696_01026 [Fonticula alba]KCV71608.1 hypothetical protein H696_01026 [Fonticula alba]|eukprot:XP_009493186.1 hypothetical protein H696_01026 [Fonticula alba]
MSMSSSYFGSSFGGKITAVDPDSVIQAVVLADVDQAYWAPLLRGEGYAAGDDGLSPALLPLANVPIIEYTLESLAMAGVQEVFLVCSMHVSQIRKYLKSSRWDETTSLMRIRVVTIPQRCSVGDALRELDSKSLFTKDIILLSSLVVFNINVAEVLQQHRERRRTNRNAVMTSVFRKVGVNHRTRPIGDEYVVFLNSDTSEILAMDSQDSPGKKYASLSLEKLGQCQAFEARNDLIDTRIDIISLEVLALATENFDYRDLRRDLVRGVLTSDILTMNIFAHVVAGSSYAAPIRFLRSYDAVSRDVIGRWTFPLVPDTNFSARTHYICNHRLVYREQGILPSHDCLSTTHDKNKPASSLSLEVSLPSGSPLHPDLAYSSELVKNVVIGRGVRVGSATRVADSVLGEGSQIGDNTSITGSYLLGRVLIGDGVHVVDSILGPGVVIRDGAVIEANCVLGSGVIVDSGVTLKTGTRLLGYSHGDDAAGSPPCSDDDDSQSDDGSGDERYTPLRGGSSASDASDAEAADDEFNNFDPTDAPTTISGHQAAMTATHARKEAISTGSLVVRVPAPAGSVADVGPCGRGFTIPRHLLPDELSFGQSDDSDSDLSDDEGSVAGVEDSVSAAPAFEPWQQPLTGSATIPPPDDPEVCRHLYATSEEDDDDDDDDFDDHLDEHEVFIREGVQTMLRAIGSNFSCDNILLEINGLKYAYNKTITQCLIPVVRAILQHVAGTADLQKYYLGDQITDEEVEELSAEQLVTLAQNEAARFRKDWEKSVLAWGDVMSKFIGSTPQEIVGAMDTLLFELLRAFASPRLAVPFFYYLYDNDLVSDDHLIGWHAHRLRRSGSDCPEAISRSLESLKALVDQLGDDSDDEDSD